MSTDPNLDHLVVVADTLEQGARWCRGVLGVAAGPGGQHALMGTHNRLVAIGSSAFPNCYLEIIAIDPQAPVPRRARWFGMDDPALLAAVREQPRLVHAVVRTAALDTLRQGLVNCGLDPGQPISAERELPSGTLRWRILVRDDGAIECDGALPTLIQWQGPHPTDQMAASPLRLEAMQVNGLTTQAIELLRLHGAQFGTRPGPALEVTLGTPLGSVRLQSWR